MQKEIVLYSIVGMSPAVLTETVWALAAKKPSVVPDEITVFTTKPCAEKLEDFCFGKNKRWDELKENIRKKYKIDVSEKLCFSREKIRIICNTRCEPLSDIRDDYDNRVMLEFFRHEMYTDYSNPNRVCIASIAGGRKTMGAMLHTVASVLGREGDKICHVLANDEIVCKHADFAFPDCKLKGGKSISAKEAGLILADVPFVGMGSMLAGLGISPNESFSRIQMSLADKMRKDSLSVVLKSDTSTLIIKKDGVEFASRNMNSESMEYLRSCYDAVKKGLPKPKNKLEENVRTPLSTFRKELKKKGFSSEQCSYVLPYRQENAKIAPENITLE